MHVNFNRDHPVGPLLAHQQKATLMRFIGGPIVIMVRLQMPTGLQARILPNGAVFSCLARTNSPPMHAIQRIFTAQLRYNPTGRVQVWIRENWLFFSYTYFII